MLVKKSQIWKSNTVICQKWPWKRNLGFCYNQLPARKTIRWESTLTCSQTSESLLTKVRFHKYHRSSFRVDICTARSSKIWKWSQPSTKAAVQTPRLSKNERVNHHHTKKGQNRQFSIYPKTRCRWKVSNVILSNLELSTTGLTQCRKISTKQGQLGGSRWSHVRRVVMLKIRKMCRKGCNEARLPTWISRSRMWGWF